MSSRRILITGLASIWGGRLARALERHPEVEVVVGIDTADPRLELERTEFVRIGPDPGQVVRIIRAARIDTVVETTLVRDGFREAGPEQASGLSALRGLLEAAGQADVGHVVVKSSAEYYGSGRDAPAFFTEDTAPVLRGCSPAQRELISAEVLLRSYAEEHPDSSVTVLRCATTAGPELQSSELALLGLPFIPGMLGFDPRWQFVHEEDVLGALTLAVTGGLSGAVNVGGDGVLALSEVADLLGKPLLPLLPPWGTLFTAGQARRLGIPAPVALLRELRYGRGLDNRRLKAAGYPLRYTSRETVLKLRAQQRIRPLLGSGRAEDFRYEPDVEDFLRRSPVVEPPGERPSIATETSGYASLTEGELLELIPSLETPAIRRLRAHEAQGPARTGVLEEIDHQLELREGIAGP